MNNGNSYYKSVVATIQIISIQIKDVIIKIAMFQKDY